MRTMGDSTTAADIPQTFDLVAGYCDGPYRWSDADWALHAGKVLVRIATRADTDDGHVLDVETGDALPAGAPAWATMRRAAGVEPTIYVNLSNEQAVTEAFALAGAPLPHYWLAHYDGIAALPAGYVAKQYADEAMTGGHYDASVVADYWPGVDPVGGQMTQAEVQALIDASIAAYGQRLQAELDDPQNGYAKKNATAALLHTHSGNVTVT
jgi:hypothetical protein